MAPRAVRTASCVVVVICAALIATCAYCAPAFALPDHRSLELVSNPAEGEPYLPDTPSGLSESSQRYATILPFMTTATGEGMVYAGEPGKSSGSGEEGPGLGNEWYAVRQPTGWVARDISPPPLKESGQEVRFGFFESLSAAGVGYLQGPASQPLAPGVEPGCTALYTIAAGVETYSPVFTNALTPASCGSSHEGLPLAVGSTSDGSTIAFQTTAALTPGSQEATTANLPPHYHRHNQSGAGRTDLGGECLFGCNLYLASHGSILSVNTVGGIAVPGATFGGVPTNLVEAPDFSNAISADASRVYWTDTEGGANHIYAFENERESVQVSGLEPAQFWTATPDGRYAYYTEGGALWRFDSSTNASTPLVSASAEVQAVVGTNQTGPDGAYVYIVANGALTNVPNSRQDVAEPGHCSTEQQHKTQAENCNLYLLHENTVTFIARLSGYDDALTVGNGGFGPLGGDWTSGLNQRVAQASADGRALVFESIEPLTGYAAGPLDNGVPQVFIYQSGSNALNCASCDPTGAPLTVSEREGHSKLPVNGNVFTSQPRWVSRSGAKVFFNSRQPLVAEDRNEVQDVYEWEQPAGPSEPNNSCTEKAASPVTGGCTFLLSDASNRADSYLLDADAEGDNVFFDHVGPLGGLDVPSDEMTVYDARVNGGFASAGTGCAAATCSTLQGPGVAGPSVPPTTTAGGPGNYGAAGPEQPAPLAKPTPVGGRLEQALSACRKLKRKPRRQRCERAARKRYGPKHAVKHSAGKGRR